MNSVRQEYGGRPFEEAVAFFQKKLNIPTRHWDDLWQEQHAWGFMIAGAMKAELLADLRNAVDRAISEGGTLADFRKDFDSIIEKTGWAYKGGRNWRTRVIYDTNLRTAYHAGRYRQMTNPGVTALRPFWQYRHGGSADPRPEHLALDGLILAHDDPFWNTHYPPNGWGCKCRVVTLSQRDLEQMDREGPDTAPEIQYREWTDRSGTVQQIPRGIDPGFAYNAGKAADQSYRVLAEKFETLPHDIARHWMDEFLSGPAFRMFYEGKIPGEFPVAVLSESDRAALGTEAQTVWLSGQTLAEHKNRHPDIGLEDYRNIPAIIETGEVYRQGATRLLYLKKEGKLYRAALKRTRDGRENYYLTLFETSDGKATKEVRETLERIR